MQMHCLGDVRRRRWTRALVAAGLAIIPAGRLAALDNPPARHTTPSSVSSLPGRHTDGVVAPASMYALDAMHKGVGKTTRSYAFPAFARQTGLACSTCHFQKYPALTPFGRAFKAAGFTITNQETIKGDLLSLSPVLNASVFLKIRYQKTNGTEVPGERTTNTGELQFPDEFAMLLGGRVSEHAGFMIEGQLADHSAPFIAGFKMPFTFRLGTSSIRANVIPFTTDALGVAYGFEQLSTGAVRNIRVNENRNAISAQQYIRTATAAEGFAFVLVDPQWFVNATKWSPNHFASAEGVANGAPTATYLRAAFTPTVGSWDLGIGIQSWTGSAGTANEDGSGIDIFKTKALAFDAQAQGAVQGLPLGVYLTYGKSAASAPGEAKNLFNSNARDRTAATVTAELGVLKKPHLTVLGGYRDADSGRPEANSDDNAWTFGLNWMVAQNIGLHWIFNKFTGSTYAAGQTPMKPGGTGDILNTLMLSAGF